MGAPRFECEKARSEARTLPLRYAMPQFNAVGKFFSYTIEAYKSFWKPYLNKINEMFEGCIEMGFLAERNDLPVEKHKQTF